MAMHDIREYEKKKYAVVVFCALHVSRISYGVLKKISHAILSAFVYYIVHVCIYTVLRDAKKTQHLFENQSPVEVSLPVYFSLAQNLIKLTLLLILVCLVM